MKITEDVLQDSIPFACRFGWHRWGKWHDAELTRFHRYHSKTYDFMGRKRECAGCGRTQING